MPGERIGNSNQYLTISGVVSAPAYSWASDNDTGLYRIGANNIGVAANGTKVLDISNTAVTITPATTLSAALTYGGVTLSNSVTGTGSMVLSASPTLTGTLTAAVGAFSNSSAGFGPVSLTNSNAGVAAGATLQTNNGTASAYFGILGTGYTTDNAFVANRSIWYSINAAGSAIIAQGGPIHFAAGGTASVGNWTSSLFTIGTAINYGGVTLSNSVTGTGSMVLSASPTLTGTLNAAAGTFTGNVTAPNYYSAAAAFRLGYAATYSYIDLYGSGGDLIAFGTGAAERMRLTSSGLGIGMTPSNVLDITKNQNSFSIANILNNNAGTASQAGYWASNGTNSARYGVLGTGYSSTGTFQAGYGIVYASSGLGICAGGGPILFGSNGTAEAARIGTSGALLIGRTAAINSEAFCASNATTTAATGYIYNSSTQTAGSTFVVRSEGAASTGWNLIEGMCSSGSTQIFIRGNGNIVNTNNSYGAISDIDLKENIADATPKLADLMNVKIRHFNLKADPDKAKQIGIVAQELETVFPGLIDHDKDGIKSVKYSVFVPMLIKAIQELKAEFDAYKASHP